MFVAGFVEGRAHPHINRDALPGSTFLEAA